MLRDRLSTHINRRTTQSIFRAFDYAKAVGSPLNLYAVINLHETAAKSAATIFECIRHKYRDWLTYATRHSVGGAMSPAYVFAMENPEGEHMHVNWVVHIPAHLRDEFIQKLARWVEKAQGVCGPFDVRVCPVKQDTAKQLANYIVKGTDPDYIDHFHLANVHVPQGEFWGKRAGISVSLGDAARKAANYNGKLRRFDKLAA